MKMIQNLLIEIGIIPMPESSSPYLKFKSIFYGIFLFLACLSVFIATLAYDIKNVKTDFEGSLFSIKQACCVFGAIYTMAALYIGSDRLIRIFQKFQNIFDESKKAI